jgi:hypothetical protein
MTTSRTDRKPDRDLLVELLNVLSASSRNNLRRDPCGDWNIIGRRGHMLTDGTSMFIYVQQTPRRWAWTKQTLDFMTVTQNGADEGILKLDGMPTAAQAAVIRKVIGLTKAPSLTDDQRDAISRRLSSSHSKTAVSGDFIGPA